MNKIRFISALWCALVVGGLGASELPTDPGAVISKGGFVTPRAFTWDWELVSPQRELGSRDWRDWIDSGQGIRKGERFRGRIIPGATVVVTDRFLDEHKERVRELNATWAPVLAHAFQAGWESPYTSQMLGEFMGMTAADLRPPTVPSVFYNNLVPYWVRKGWESPTGLSMGSSTTSRVVVTNTSADRPIILYPGRH